MRGLRQALWVAVSHGETAGYNSQYTRTDNSQSITRHSLNFLRCEYVNGTLKKNYIRKLHVSKKESN